MLSDFTAFAHTRFEMAFIREYEQRDFAAMAHICRETIPPSLQASSSGWLLAPYLWTHAYTLHSPSTCLVLDSGDGTAVGYCIACPSVIALKESWPSYTASVVSTSSELTDLHLPVSSTPREEWSLPDGSVNDKCLAQLLYDPERLLIEEAEGLLKRGIEATLHVDILQEWQGQGWGRKLVEEVVARLSKTSKGVFLGMASDNTRVIPFYERLGFRLWKNDDEDEGTLTMVKEFSGEDAEEAGT